MWWSPWRHTPQRGSRLQSDATCAGVHSYSNGCSCSPAEKGREGIPNLPSPRGVCRLLAVLSGVSSGVTVETETVGAVAGEVTSGAALSACFYLPIMVEMYLILSETKVARYTSVV